MADEDDDDLVRFVSWQTIDLSPSAVQDVHDAKPMFLILHSDVHPSQLLKNRSKNIRPLGHPILRKSWCIQKFRICNMKSTSTSCGCFMFRTTGIKPLLCHGGSKRGWNLQLMPWFRCHGELPQNAQAELIILRSGEPSNACRVRCYTQDLSGQDGDRREKFKKLKRQVGQVGIRGFRMVQ